jgi:mono/diheme cytochrome c family protein
VNRVHQRLALWLCFSFSGVIASATLSPEQIEQLPAPASHRIDFQTEVKPIFDASCIKCHGRGRAKGGFRLDSRETVLKGGDSGAVVVPAKSAESYLIELVSGLNPDTVMPQKGSKLTREQVGVLRAWIDQGVTWSEGVSFARLPPVNLAPPEPIIPAGPDTLGSINPIDLLLRPYFARHHVTPRQTVSDRVYARRVFLDVIGLLPSPGELEEFVVDEQTDKRERLVKRLLRDNQRYAEHWLTFWNDLLRNDYKGTGFIDEGRKQITDWLYSALAKNLPFDQFVAQLVNPTPESEGFVKGIVWRGVVNASQTPQMQAAQNISQVFMGVNLKCASCHDSFINDWMLADAYGLASVYADHELEMVRCDKPTGQTAPMKFLYPELGSIDPKASKVERMKRLAEIMTQKQNGRLSRTIVNRLWARFVGRGLVEPLDDMEQRAWNADLLDWLAADLVENGYDLRKTMERILTSQVYQLPSVPASEQVPKDYVFQGPLVRRLSAEQFQDALSRITGVWHAVPESAQADFSAGLPDYALSEVENPARIRWIWNDADAAEKAPPGTVYFRKEIALPEEPTQASAVITCDNSFKLYVNGKEVASGQDHNKPNLVDLKSHLRSGTNVLAVAAVNQPAAPDKKDADQANPAGLICYVRVRHESSRNGVPLLRIWDVGTADSWLWSTNKVEGWEKTGFAAAGWKPAAELGPVGMAPWKLEKKLAQAMSAASLAGHVRAALVTADPLMTALGRPNREQVLTTRTSAATTLQALEMTNGKTLAEALRRGSEKLLANSRLSTRELVISLFERALARPPKPDELELSQELVGTPAKKEGVEDLLWAVAMLPEFQLIY